MGLYARKKIGYALGVGGEVFFVVPLAQKGA